jgi:hypothetical protein
MFRLVYEYEVRPGVWVSHEDNFTANERRTAVEIARERSQNPRYRSVALYDFTLTQSPVKTLTKPAEDPKNHKPRTRKTVTLTVPRAEVVDLKRLPRKKPVKILASVKFAASANQFNVPASVKKPKPLVKV